MPRPPGSMMPCLPPLACSQIHPSAWPPLLAPICHPPARRAECAREDHSAGLSIDDIMLASWFRVQHIMLASVLSIDWPHLELMQQPLSLTPRNHMGEFLPRLMILQLLVSWLLVKPSMTGSIRTSAAASFSPSDRLKESPRNSSNRKHPHRDK